MKKKDIVFFSALLVVFGVAVTVVVFSGSTFTPVVAALILAYILDPLVGLLEKRKFNRTMAIIMVFFSFLILFFLLVGILVVSFQNEFQGIQINLPDYADRAYNLIPQQVKEYLNIETPDKLDAQINRGLEQLRAVSFDVFREAFTFIKKAFTSTLGFVLALLSYIITPLYLYYFLKDFSKIKSSVVSVIPERYRHIFLDKMGEINELLSAFVRGQLAVCAILGVLYSIGLYFIGIDLALVIGTFSGITFIIPYLGTILGIVFSMLMAALKFHDFLHPFLCLAWFLIVQALEGSIITPKIVGHKVGLHPVVTILAVILGGQLFGIIGMLLAVPVTAVLKVFFRSLLEYYRKSPYYTGG